tara:strand:- start:762 stop:887 length:126 start_codon:yes stop_codon:yes gene_type:complete
MFRRLVTKVVSWLSDPTNIFGLAMVYMFLVLFVVGTSFGGE